MSKAEGVLYKCVTNEFTLGTAYYRISIKTQKITRIGLHT
jgi:hypothetical protein